MDYTEIILLLLLVVVIIYFMQYKENFMYVQYVYGLDGNCNDYIPLYSFCDKSLHSSSENPNQIENFACGCASKNKFVNSIPNMTYVWEGFENLNMIMPPNIVDGNIISKSNPNASCPNPICPMRVGCPCLPGCQCPEIKSSALDFVENNMKNDILYKSNAPTGFDDVQ